MNVRTWMLATALATVSAFGQRAIEVNVPFEFWAAKQTWAAGTYEVTFPSPNCMKLLSVNDNKSVLILLNAGETAKPEQNSGLVFRKYGENHFLRQIVLSGSKGHELPVTAHEREMAARFPNAPAIARVVKK